MDPDSETDTNDLMVRNNCRRCGKEFFYSYESDICPACFAIENEERKSYAAQNIGLNGLSTKDNSGLIPAVKNT